MKNKKGFTLPEILITVVVIGIIAAITINIINTNVRKAEIESKLKQNYAIFNNALTQATIDNGAIDSWPIFREKGSSTLTEKEFLEKYIIPNIKLIKPLEQTSLKELGYSRVFKQPNGSNDTNFPYTANFNVLSLNNGTIIFPIYYGNKDGLVIPMDINGIKGPNVFGKDAFAFYIDFNDFTPRVWGFGATLAGASGNINNCKTYGQYCATLIQAAGWKIPKDYPVKI